MFVSSEIKPDATVRCAHYIVYLRLYLDRSIKRFIMTVFVKYFPYHILTLPWVLSWRYASLGYQLSTNTCNDDRILLHIGNQSKIQLASTLLELTLCFLLFFHSYSLNYLIPVYIRKSNENRTWSVNICLAYLFRPNF